MSEGINKILRSLLVLNDKPDQENAARNFEQVLVYRIDFTEDEEKEIFNKIKNHFSTYRETPTIQDLRDAFELEKNPGAILVLDEISKEPCYVRSSFEALVMGELEKQRIAKIHILAKESAHIASHGLKIGKVELKGVNDAIRHFTGGADSLLVMNNGVRLSGDVTQDHDDFIEEVEYTHSHPEEAYGCLTGIIQVDEGCMGVKPSEFWAHAAYSGGLKCISGGSRIFDSRVGILREARDVYQNGAVGLYTHSLNHATGQIELAGVSHIQENGVRPVFVLESSQGRQTGVSDNHPFLTPNGYVELKDLKIGDWIAVPSRLPIPLSATNQFTDAHAKLIGYMLGGGYMNKGLTFVTVSDAIRTDFIEQLVTMGYVEGKATPLHPHFRSTFPKTRVPTLRMGHSARSTKRYCASPLLLLLQSLGLMGKIASTKFIPNQLWSMSDHQLKLLVGAMWSTDGHLSVWRNGKGKRVPSVKIKYTTKSRQLGADLQLVLQRLGIRTSLDRHWVKYKGERRLYWTIAVIGHSAKFKFLTDIVVIGKTEACRLAIEALETQRDTCDDHIPLSVFKNVKIPLRAVNKTGKTPVYIGSITKKQKKVSRTVALQFASVLNDPSINTLLSDHLNWEQVRSIVCTGEEMTYDLSVPSNENFVVDGFVTHNTTFALNWAYFTAVFLRKNAEYFSLEMPYKQVRRILKVMHSTHWKFTDAPSEGGLGWEPLEYKKVRDGKLTPIELERLKYISKDLSNQELHGAIHVVKPDREVTIADLRFVAEAQHKKTPLSVIFIDYLQLVQSSDKSLRSTTERQNEVARAGKHLAMNFNGGAGIAVIGLWQINNEGYKHAQKKMEAKEEKKGGVYDLSHLSWANELKNAADYVTYTYVDDDLRATNEAIIGNMKNRDNSIFSEARMRVEWGQRKLESLMINSPLSANKSFETAGVKDLDIDVLLGGP